MPNLSFKRRNGRSDNAFFLHKTITQYYLTALLARMLGFNIQIPFAYWKRIKAMDSFYLISLRKDPECSGLLECYTYRIFIR